MKTKTILTIIFCSLIAFFLGFWVNNQIQKPNRQTEVSETKPAPSKTVRDTIIKFIDADTTDRDFSKELKGRFILKGATYAGFDFISAKQNAWTNEIDPGHPDTMRVNWVDKTTFATIRTEGINKGCPPRTWVHKVMFYDGRKLILKDVETGWTDSPDHNLTFYKEQ